MTTTKEEKKLAREAKMEKIVKGTNDFYKSKKSLVIFMSLIGIFASIQYILFATGNLTINGINFVDNPEHASLAWLSITLGVIATTLSVIGCILSMVGNLWFLPFLVGNSSICFFNYVLAGSVFISVAMIWSIISVTTSFFLWRNKFFEKHPINKRNVVIGTIIFFFLLLGTFVTITYFFGESMYVTAATGTTKPVWTWYFDCIASSLAMSAAILWISRMRWSYCLYATSKIFTLCILIQAGNLIQIFQLFLFWTLDLSGFLAWTIHVIEEKKQMQINKEKVQA